MTNYTAEQALTHHVRLILDNDEGLYNMRREIVRETIAEYAETEFSPKVECGDRLRELYEQLVGDRDDLGVAAPDLPALEILSTALAFVALAFVDWYEMAADYIAEESE